MYLPVLDMLAELDRRFSTDSMALSEACDAVFSCDKNGIGPLLSTYASFQIYPQLLNAEMDLVKCAMASPITLKKRINEAQKDQYPQKNQKLAPVCNGSGQIFRSHPIGQRTI